MTEQSEPAQEVPQEPRIPDNVAEAIFEAKETLDKAMRKAEIAKANKKEADASVESWQEQVNDLIRQAKDGIGPLFATEEPQQEDWQGLPIDALMLKPQTNGHLCAVSIETIGELVDHQKEHGETWADEIPKIGPVARQEIDDAMEKFWEQHGTDTIPDSEPA